MGQEVCRAVAGEDDLELVAAVDPACAGAPLAEVAGLDGVDVTVAPGVDGLGSAGAQVVVGVNAHTETAPSPLTSGEGDFLAVDPAVEAEQIAALQAWRRDRDRAAVDQALAALLQAAKEARNIMEPSIACAHAGVTTGEWTEALRKIWGEYRAPTGVGRAVGGAAHDGAALAAVRRNIAQCRQIEDLLAERGFRVLEGGELSIACVRYEPAGSPSSAEVDALQSEIARRAVATGKTWFATVRHDDRTWLRFNLVNVHTRDQHAREIAELTAGIAEELTP